MKTKSVSIKDAQGMVIWAAELNLYANELKAIEKAAKPLKAEAVTANCQILNGDREIGNRTIYKLVDGKISNELFKIEEK